MGRATSRSGRGVGLGSVFFAEGLLWRLLGNGTMLVLTSSATCLVVACGWAAPDGPARALPGTGWLRSFGRLSYECYLTHMFVVFAVVDVFAAVGAPLAQGHLWYPPAVALSWLVGALVARFFSTPCDRALRKRWLPAAASSPSRAGSP